MSDESNSNEFSAETVEEAIAKGVNELGLKPGEFMVEVLQEPRRGLFGAGSRPAIVKLKMLRRSEPRTVISNYQPEKEEEKVVISSPPQETGPRTQISDPTISGMADEDLSEEASIAKTVLTELLGEMGFDDFKIIVTLSDPSEDGSNTPWMLNVEGKRASVLIGRRGDTLASLQYITRLIVSRRMQRRANIIVDADGYKARRSQRLKDLAIRMADQAVSQGRSVTLEPMPPHERRMIHMTLREREDVFTKSTGEGDSRKVMIVPK